MQQLGVAGVGEWLSLVEHLVRDQGVGGSNPLSPTIFSQANQRITTPAQPTQTIRAQLGPLNICPTFATALRASAGTECPNAMASAEANDGVAS